MDALKVKEISKRFGKKEVLKGIDFELKTDKIYGLLGRSGAGKSTLLNIMNNRLLPTNGTVLLDGEVVFENDSKLKRLFLANDRSLFPKEMKVKEAFKAASSFVEDFDEEECQRLCQLFDLNLKSKIVKLSTGYHSVFKFILALSMPASFVFLDEPVLGLDAVHRELFYEQLLAAYEKRPRTFVISTHLIEEVGHLIEEALILHHGKIVANGNVEELLADAFSVTGEASLVEETVKGFDVMGSENLGGLKTVYVKKGNLEMDSRLTVQPLDLQKYFVWLTRGGKS